MKIKKLSPTKTLLLASASKLALASGIASANNSGGGKGDEGTPPEVAPQLKLNQFVQPVDAFIPPLNDPDIAVSGSMYEDEYASYDNAGILFVGEIPDEGARMDFIVSHIRNDKPVDVFVVCGTQLAPDEEGDLFPGMDIDLGDYEDYEEMEGEGMEDEDMMLRQAAKPVVDVQPVKPGGKKPKPGKKPNPGQGNKPPTVYAGEICVDLETEMEILAGVRINPSKPLLALDTKLGQALQPNFTSTIISVHLSKEKLRQLRDQELFFQAAAIPVDNADPFGDTQVSECDRYLISDLVEPGEGVEGSTGTKDEILGGGTSTATDGATTADNGSKQ
jgi:hypothetical protein